MNNHKSRSAINLLIGAALLLSACASARASTPTAPPPTDTPTTLPPTATATPLPPTATATATAIPPTATPTPTPNVTATRAAAATETAAPAIALIDAELKKYDLSTGAGYLGWVNDALTIKVNTYLEEKRQTNYPEVSMADFAFHSDMTWETSTGLAGCGFVLRSESDLDRGKQYRVYMVRILNLPLWDIEYYKHDQFQRNVTGDLLSAGALNTEQGSTNAITIIVQGGKLAVYGNGDRLGIFTHNALSQGILGYMAFQESGETTCTFTNSWLWVLKAGE